MSELELKREAAKKKILEEVAIYAVCLPSLDGKSETRWQNIEKAIKQFQKTVENAYGNIHGSWD